MHIMVVWTARTAAADLLGMTWGSTLVVLYDAALVADLLAAGNATLWDAVR
jgi:hypothetical protein